VLAYATFGPATAPQKNNNNMQCHKSF